MNRQWLKVKEWKVREENHKLAAYNSDLVLKRDDKAHRIEEDGCFYILVSDVVKESEKAVCVIAETGDVLDSLKNEYKMWIPKSCLAQEGKR